MEKIYTNTNSLKETQTTRSTSTSTNSLSGSASFFKTLALTLAMLVVGIGSSWGQAVSSYTPLITSGTYSAITGTSILGNVDDGNSSATNIGFTFNLGGQNFTQFVANSNGHIRLGATGSATNLYIPLSTTTNTYSISAVGRDGKSTGGVIHTVSGSAPNRISIIQYTNFDLVYNATTRRVSFQIRLYETTNVVEIIYTGAVGNTTSATVQVGLRGSTTTADVRNYSGSNSGWSALTAGTTSTSTIRWGSSQNTTRSMPSNGRILRWTPPVVPACTGTPAPGNTISSSATVAPGGTVNLSLQNATSGTGVTYQWESSTTSSTAGYTNISGATSSTYTATVTANTWYRCKVTCSGSTGTSTATQVTLVYCTPTAASDDATGITFVGFNTISNTSVGDPAYTNNTGISTSVFQNTAYPLTVRVNTAGAYTVNVLAWIDWNQNLTFEAGEQYNLGSALSVTDANTTASPFSITVPETALLGNTVMRVRATYSVAPTACGAQSYSEAEDYTINVQATPLATCPTLTSPANAATGVSLTPTLTWTAGANTSTYDVYLSTNQTDVNNQAVGARVSTSQAGTSYTSAALSPSTLYYWRVVPKNSFGTAATGCTTRSFTTSAPSPTISQSGSLSAFSACANVASTQQSFSVSGLYLSGNLVVTAPTGFSVSTTSGAGFTSSVSLTPSNSTVSSTLIYVRMNALASNPTSGNIVCSSTSASSVNVAVSGTVLESPTSASAGADVTICSGQSVSLVGSATGFSGSGSTSSSASSVYSGGNASSLYLTGPTTSSNNTTCPMDLTVSIPSGATITGVDVSYTVTAGGAGWLSENITYLECTSTGGAKEGTYSTAGGDNSGSAVLSRAALSIANSVAGGGNINFRLHQFRTYGGAGCNTTYNYINDQTFTVTVYYTAPTTDLTYAWVSSPVGFTYNGASTSDSPAQTTTYTLTASAENGCTASANITATIAGTAPNAPTASSADAAVNVGGTTTLTASGAGGTYTWYDAASGGTNLGSGSTLAMPVNCSSGSATYYVDEDNGACVSGSRGSVSVTIRDMVPTDPSNSLICSSGGSVTLSSQLTGGSSISWSPSTNLSTTSGSSTVASPTTTTLYTMNATVSGCGSVSATQAVGVIDAVDFTPTSSPAAVCAGNTAALASNLASSGFVSEVTTYSMDSPSGETYLVTGGSATVAATSCIYCPLDDASWEAIPIGFTYNFFGNDYTTVNVGVNGNVQFGTYNGTASGGLGDFTFTSFPNAAEPLNVIAAPAVDLNAGDGGDIRYWVKGIAPTRVFILEWNGVPGWSNPANSNGTNTSQIKLFETTGNVEVHVQNSSSTSNKVVGLQNADASIGTTASSGTGTLTNQAWKFIPGANYSFQWATAGSNIGGATATTYTTPTLNTPGTVTYSVAATNPNTQCATTKTVSLVVNALPAAPNSSGDVTACGNASNQNLVVTVGAGETADWYAAATGGSILTSPNGAATTSLTVPSGSSVGYYAQAKNTTTSCTSSSRTLVSYSSGAVPVSPTSSGATYCQGVAAAALSASAPSGTNTQNWYTVSTGGSALSGAPTPSTATATTLTYYVGETGTNGCESARTAVSVVVNPTPAAPTASNPSPYCENAAASALSATSDGSSTLYWYTVPTGGTGSTTAITPSTSSSGSVNYYVAQRTAQNCESPRTSIAVDVNPSITASVANGASSTSACGASAITFTASPTNGGSSPTYQWYLNGSAVGNGASTYVTNPAADNAGNYSGTWNSGSNQGSGMGPWAFTVGNSSGAFIGNPSNDGNGTAGIGTSAHGLYANGNEYINTTRNFSTPMQIGDELRFYWVFNWDANGGGKGFDLKASGSTIFNVNNGVGSTITAGGATADAGYGTTPMYVTVKRTSASVYTFTMTRRSNGTTYTATFNNSNAIDGINFYIGNQNETSGNRNLYFNGLEMRPPQTNDAIYVEMTPSAQACLTSASATSSSTITLTSTASTPTVAIQSSAASAVCPGVPVTFSVNTSANMGSGPSYQWKLNGTNIQNATTATYVSSALANNDQISLEMTSSLSPVCLTAASAQSSTIATAVSTSTSITSQPAASSACASGSTSFTVTGAGQGTLTYQWQKGGVNVTGNQSATTNVLTLSGVSASDIADYTVDVTGSCGSVTSNTAAFTINPATSITSQPTISPQCVGSNATFTVAGTGHNTLSYQWNFNGSAISGATSATLVESSITSADAGQYSVVVTGGCGSVTSSNAQLTVQPATTIATQPSSVTLCAGNNANFAVTASGAGSLNYQWKLNGSAVPSQGTNSSYTVPNAQSVNSGNYTVDITGQCGTITSAAAPLTVNALTTISAQPVASTSVCEGQNVSLDVSAAGTGILTYQWKRNGVSITSGGTLASLTTSDDGTYTVVVTGDCGNSTSSNAVVSILQPQVNLTVGNSTIGNGDYLWNGNTSTDGSVASNWYVLNSNVYSVASQSPTAATEVFIVSFTDASTCVSQSNSASIPASGSFSAGNMYVGTSASIALGTNATLEVSGNFTNNGTFTPGTGTVNMNGSSAQTINGSAAITFNNLTINNAAGVSLNTEINTNGILTLTNGVLSLGAQNLYIGTGGSIAVTSPSASRMISTSGSGELRKRFAPASNQNPANFLFPIGTPGEYTPVNLDFSDVDFGNDAYMRARSVAQKSGFMNASISNYLNRNWIVEPVNISNFTYDITYTYVQEDYVGNAGAEGSLKPIKYSTPGGVGQWYQPQFAGFDNAEEIGDGSVNSTSNVAQWSGLNSFSEFGGAEGNGQPLPVELVSFTGACDNGIINLTWQTASEFNSEHFDVEKSRDGENWLLLTTMPAAGTSNELITYQYGDDQATDGNNYFRLRQVDIDGTEKLYDPINVSCKEVTTGYFTSYPNPSGSSFQLVVNNKELLGNCVMNIVDASGKVIEQLNIEVKEGINLFMINQALNPGIYFLNITNGDKSTPVVRHAVN